MNTLQKTIDYYTNYIRSRDDWQFVEVYTHAGISTNDATKIMTKKVIDAM